MNKNTSSEAMSRSSASAQQKSLSALGGTYASQNALSDRANQAEFSSRRRAISADEAHIHKPSLHSEMPLDSMQSSSILSRPEIQETFRSIRSAQQEGADYEDDFLPVPVAVADRAYQIVKQTAREAYFKSLFWEKPAVSATIDGGIFLSWQRKNNWATLTLFPVPKAIESVTKDRDNPARYEMISDKEAVERVIHIFTKR